MIRQYGAQRCRGGANPLRVGTIPAGAILYLQNEGWWRDPWIVEGFLNGLMHASRLDHDTGLWEDAYMAGRSDMAVVRSLRDGCRRRAAVRTLVLHEEEGLAAQPVGYPSLPDLRFYWTTQQQPHGGTSRCQLHQSPSRPGARPGRSCPPASLTSISNSQLQLLIG